jgi:hypothetical protein
MVTTLILHVGPHKTGTTALQAALATNADLLARFGVLYPTTGRSGDSHADLAPALRDAFPGAEVRVSYRLRRLSRLWPAHWAELVKHGQDPGFADYLAAVARRDARPFQSPILPARQLERLAEAFGPAALRIAVHDHHRAEGQDLGPAFIDELLGLGQIAPAFATTARNITPSETETALVWLLNRHAGSRANHVTKGKARRVLLDQVAARPAWLADLTSAVQQAERIDIGSDHPLVAAEERAVAARHHAAIAEGIDAYLAPITAFTVDLASLDLRGDTRAALAVAFDAALATVHPNWSRP